MRSPSVRYVIATVVVLALVFGCVRVAAPRLVRFWLTKAADAEQSSLDKFPDPAVHQRLRFRHFQSAVVDLWFSDGFTLRSTLESGDEAAHQELDRLTAWNPPLSPTAFRRWQNPERIVHEQINAAGIQTLAISFTPRKVMYDGGTDEIRFIVRGSDWHLVAGRFLEDSFVGYSYAYIDELSYEVVDRRNLPARFFAAPPGDAVDRWVDIGDFWPTRFAIGKGNAAFVYMWATWCEPCLDELPFVQQLFDRLKAQSRAEFATVNFDRQESAVSAFMREHGYTFPVRRVPELQVHTLPRAILLDAGHNHSFEQTGFTTGPQWVKDTSAKVESLK
jgi:thiol-disulfide isomerase/thioredoxin